MSLPPNDKAIINPSEHKATSIRQVFWIGLSVFVSLGLVVYLLRRFDLNYFVTIVTELPLWILPSAFGLYLFLNICRAYRFRTLLNQNHLPINRLLPVVMYHNFLVRTLPFMTGEISYPALLRRYLNQKVSEGLSSLFGARLFEMLLVVLGGLFGVILWGAQELERAPGLLVSSILGLVFIILVLYFAAPLVRIGISFWRYVIGLTPWRDLALLNQIGERLDEIPEQLGRLRHPRLFVHTFLYSILTYGSSIGFYLLLLSAVGLQANLGILLLVITLVIFVSAIPFSISGFGVIESGWAVALVTLAGIGDEKAIAIGFFMHGCQVLVNVVTGLIGLMMLLRLR